MYQCLYINSTCDHLECGSYLNPSYPDPYDDYYRQQYDSYCKEQYDAYYQDEMEKLYHEGNN